MVEKYYTPEQLQQLEQRRQHLGDDKIQQEWADLDARLREVRKAGVDPAAEEPQALGRRAGELTRCSRAATRGSGPRDPCRRALTRGSGAIRAAASSS